MGDDFSFADSYCGVPPPPALLWQTWNLDPVLLAGLGAAALAGLLVSLPDPRDRVVWVGGVALLAVAFVSPLCALANALLSARVVHHVLLVAVAAPMFAFGARRLLASAVAERLIGPFFLLHLAVFWLWHLPAAYEVAIAGPGLYWLMQATLLGSATALWTAVFAAPRNARGISALLGTIVHMGLFAALLVFSPEPLYRPHLATTAAYGLDPLADQQLAGLVMWVPAAAPYLAVALVLLVGWLQPKAARA